MLRCINQRPALIHRKVTSCQTLRVAVRGWRACRPLLRASAGGGPGPVEGSQPADDAAGGKADSSGELPKHKGSPEQQGSVSTGQHDAPWWSPVPHLARAVQRFIRALDNVWLRIGVLAAFVIALVSAVINWALVPLVNTTMLPEWQAAACKATLRKVTLGPVGGVSLAGVTGFVPLLRLGPTSVGPGPYEKSSVLAPQGIDLYLDPLTSLVQQQVVLAVSITAPEVTVVQGYGFSWLGYPDDTTPSSRNLLPGLAPAPEPTAESAQSEVSPEQEESLPPVAVGKLTLRQGKLAVLVQSERVPRYLENVQGTLTLGRQYRALNIHVEADAHKRHTSSLKCTLVAPTAKRHLRHVTPGAASPAPLQFGCDVLPAHLQSQLSIQHIPGSAQWQGEGQQEGSEHTSMPSSPPADPTPVSVHDMVRWKRGRQAEAATAQGQPLHYTLTSYGPLLSRADAHTAERAATAHVTALRTGEPHHWPDAPWAQQPQPRTPVRADAAALTHTHHPSGGHLEMRLTALHVNTPDVWPDMTVTIRASELHAPLTERLLELPMDIHQGTLTGELKIRTYDHKSWQFPELYGRVQLRDVGLHFWDASDDLAHWDTELVFERDRVYLHRARGWFGAAPLALAGDLDVNPETGSYRLSASVLPLVEVNALRATLGVRPTPQPVSGALRGVLHCTGPLEHPVFSGSAVAVRSPQDQLLATEATPAREALMAHPTAVGVFDRVPLTAGTAVFSMDTATQRFSLHSAQVVPVGGGQFSGQGVMLTSPEAESDPRAIQMVADASGLDVGSLLGCYLPPEVKEQLPSGALSSLGVAQVRGTMMGSHLAPQVTAQATLPSDSRLVVGATAAFTPTAMSFTAQGPALSLDTTVHISTPHSAALRASNTQAEASFWARPRFEGLDLSASLTDLDLLPLARTATAPTLDPVSTGQPLRARCSGSVRCSLRPAGPPVPTSQGRPHHRGGASLGAQAGLSASHPSLMFTGAMQLSSVRLNNLELVHSVSGQLGISAVGKLLCRARATPLASPLLGVSAPSAHAPTQTAGRTAIDSEVFDVEVAVQDLLPGLNLDPIWVSESLRRASAQELDEVSDSRWRVQRGALALEASSANAGREYRLMIGGVQLDELEAGSLRGALSHVSLEANIEDRQGRAALALDSLRYASLAAERLSSSVRWEGDVVKLEETVVVQQGSRYELDGEVFLPDLLARAEGGEPQTEQAPQESATRDEPLGEGEEEDGKPTAGRWRLAVHVPSARVQDLLPATQLLSATQHAGRDYAAAKGSFLSSLETAGLRASLSVPSGLTLSSSGAGAGGGGAHAPPVSGGVIASATSPAASVPPLGSTSVGPSGTVLPALQELSGAWSGHIQFYGDGQGATNVEFNLQGRDWRWGMWRLDRISAVGVADSDEGVGLEELSVVSGPARACLKGALLGSRQDSTLAITNFPLAMLQPLYSALPPALQGVQPQSTAVVGVLRPFASLSRRLETSMARLSSRLLGEPGQLLGPGLISEPGLEPGLTAAGVGVGPEVGPGPGPVGPVSGLVFLNGWLGGSLSAPEATVDVRVEQGAVGSTRLKQAEAHMALDSKQCVTASVQLQPADSEGNVVLTARVEGVDGDTPTSKLRAVDRSISASVNIRDGGMAVLCSLSPVLQWQSGSAALDVEVQGTLAAPRASGAVRMSNVTLSSPALKHPVTHLRTDIQFTGSHMVVNSLSGKVGKLGQVQVSGSLPIVLPSPSSPLSGVPEDEVTVQLTGLDLRVANMYTGALDAELHVDGALLAPTLGGSITFSRGTLNLQPPAATSATPSSTLASTAARTAATPSNDPQASTVAPPSSTSAQDAAMVRSAFALLRAGRKHAALMAATEITDTLTHTSTGATHAPPPPPHPACQLNNLQLTFGPELRATFPVVLNVVVSGQVSLSGPADPLLLSPSGAILLESGTLNLVATQFTLDREHANRLLFFPESGLMDPTLDIVLLSGDLRATLAGRCSAWHEALSLSAAGTALSTPPQSGVSGAGPTWDTGKQGDRGSGPSAATQLELAEMARVFEERLAEALLGDNGQLALRSLASSTLHTLLPKLETRGQLGAARWRLVGAPALPNLLGVLDAASSPSPSSSSETLDPAKLLSRLAVGTELELMWGDSLVAALQHKLLSDTKIGTEARLTYRITNHLRLNLKLQGLTHPSLILGYTSDML